MKTLAKIIGFVMVVVAAYCLYHGIDAVISMNTAYLVIGCALLAIPK